MNLNRFLHQIKKLYDTDRLSHLYLMRHGEDLTSEIFFKELMLTVLNKTLNSHPDFLKVEVDEDEKIYKVDSNNIDTFIKFVSFNPSNLKHRFVVISDAHLISEVLSNKLLKTFEELSQKCTIFLLVPKYESIIATIKSRSIEILLEEIARETLKSQSTSEYKDLLKKGNATLDDILRAEIDNTNFSYKSAELFLNDIKTASLAQKFNNSQNSNLALLLP